LARKRDRGYCVLCPRLDGASDGLLRCSRFSLRLAILSLNGWQLFLIGGNLYLLRTINPGWLSFAGRLWKVYVSDNEEEPESILLFIEERAMMPKQKGRSV